MGEWSLTWELCYGGVVTWELCYGGVVTDLSSAVGEWSLTWELCCGGVVTDLGGVLWGSGH